MSADGDVDPAAEHSALPCLACRETGQVSSGLGGSPHQVTCPWCQGTGRRIPGIDAQEHPSEAGGAPPSEAPSS
jgi:DnaJ-class molecular chaperone